MINLTFNNWRLGCGPLVDVNAQQYDNETIDLVVSGDIPSGYTWLAYLAIGTNLNIVLLTECSEGLSASLSAADLAVHGMYKIQVRAVDGERVRHTNQVAVLIPSTLTGDAVWPEVPAAFTQLLDATVAAAREGAESAEAAAGSAGDASDSAAAAATSEENAEAWAVGRRNGADVPSTDPTYENNAKYYAQQAGAQASAAADSEDNADRYAQAAEDARDLAIGAKNDAVEAQRLAEAAESTASGYKDDAGRSASSAADSAVLALASERAAAASESAADESARTAEAWAVGRRNGADVPSSDPTHDNNAKYYAEAAEQSAQLATVNAGYMFFAINNAGHLIYTRTSNTLVSFYLSGGHLYVEAIG